MTSVMCSKAGRSDFAVSYCPVEYVAQETYKLVAVTVRSNVHIYCNIH